MLTVRAVRNYTLHDPEEIEYYTFNKLRSYLDRQRIVISADPNVLITADVTHFDVTVAANPAAARSDTGP